MIYTKRTIEKKQGKKWIVDSVSLDSMYIDIMLIDELTGKFLFKSKPVNRIRYEYGKIIVNYNNGLRVIYE